MVLGLQIFFWLGFKVLSFFYFLKFDSGLIVTLISLVKDKAPQSINYKNGQHILNTRDDWFNWIYILCHLIILKQGIISVECLTSKEIDSKSLQDLPLLSRNTMQEVQKHICHYAYSQKHNASCTKSAKVIFINALVL